MQDTLAPPRARLSHIEPLPGGPSRAKKNYTRTTHRKTLAPTKRLPHAQREQNRPVRPTPPGRWSRPTRPG
eukprot:8941523-Lingulodinium_polyedra.AAC.1